MARAFGAQTMEVSPAEWLQSFGVLLGYLSSFNLSAQFQGGKCREVLWIERLLMERRESFMGGSGVESVDGGGINCVERERGDQCETILWEGFWRVLSDCVREVSGQENPRKWERGFERWLRGEFMEPVKMDQRGNRWLVGAGRVDCNIATLETV
ncbi:hypothetical protein COLO4_33180 [Corchorus olitorius]|uniref:Uncharacterized protein n=1 Tax=Corchorus olitorius TaxID=93759 RepID=A0A1R3GW13_9ROSI|nr:hypothetical protein COLO4_33180 [Corchorus olitorius]